ncbi:MAG TPA: TetR/AcrR family transcriptional regulator [Burkholderiaceae bacterium]|jgi:TetR/AcrR family transcriptional repressor of nem operon
MPRPREFDETQVLAAAVSRFWAYGYEATSVRDLADSMGIAGASLYNAFGDKRSLYRRALDHYVVQSVGERIVRLERDFPPRAAIGAFLDEVIERSLSDPERKGCMLVNAALEVAPHDPEFQRVVAGVMKEIEAFFHRCVQKGQADGTIKAAQNADELAKLLLSVLLGIRVLARARPERDLLEGLARSVATVLDQR